MNLRSMGKQAEGKLIRGLPTLNYQKDRTCGVCQMGKQTKVAHRGKSLTSTV